MARIEATTHVEASPARVWAVLTDWEAQPGWMRDARSVEVRSTRREGVGVSVCARFDLAGLVLDDEMVTTEWVPPERLVVRHAGPVLRGVGAFELTQTDYGTHLRWWEEINAPLGPLGEALSTLVVPFVERTFRGSLANLKRACERRARAADATA